MSQDVINKIKTDVEANKIVLYMKGTPDAPQCGFSQATVQLLRGIGEPFEARDVISNPELREFVPQYSNWPTFPQLFINGKLVGGCDIVHEMHEKGELESLIKQTK
jgi:monothiol glutaredoxin